jgi:hypothetical protein
MKWMNFPLNNQRYVQLDVVAVKVVGEAERTIGFEPVWKGKKPNRTEINRFEPVFGSVRFKKLKKNRFGCLFWFKTGPNRKCSALRLTYKGKGKYLLLPSLQEA